NVHEGIESTLILLRSSLPPYIKIIKNFQARSKLECYPGKLNQVFMNILTNAIQAIKAKEQQAEESITITTTEQDGHLIISIKDTGT
ncbi:GHKL domain-containing protein, partial [Mycobacterium ulcerans]